MNWSTIQHNVKLHFEHISFATMDEANTKNPESQMNPSNSLVVFCKKMHCFIFSNLFYVYQSIIISRHKG